MEAKERTLVLERLRELEGWAEYIIEALHLDQPSESVKRKMLEQALPGEKLRQIRELSWMLRDKLHVVNTQLEYSDPAQKSQGAA